jgi:protein SCO1/2
LAVAGGAAAAAPATAGGTNALEFSVKGVVKELAPDRTSVVISHEAVPGYMAAMTMPFKVRDQGLLRGLSAGDEVVFHLHVTGEESWVDGIRKTGKTVAAPDPVSPTAAAAPRPTAGREHPLRSFKFTNELGQRVSLDDFRGQALAITFFFTRCPIPEYCPRLSRNFQEASARLASMPDAPTNWHFLSFTFDPDFDTPAVLKAYAERYHYDPAHWSLLTGPRDKINELARLSGVEVNSEAGLFNHNFRTLIVDARGRLQMTFPFGGNLSDALVAQMLKAAGATRAAASDAGGAGTKVMATAHTVSMPSGAADKR